METMTQSLPLALPAYTQLICQYDSERRALWAYFNPTPRPCFTPTLLAEIRDLQLRLTAAARSEAASDIRYFVFASAVPGVFNLGGDVQLFARLIMERDRDGLYEYGRKCVDAVYADAIGFGVPGLTTIALVQGSALGGGFECALSCNTIIAEESAQFGFPEILFNLFPGMGAMSFLARRIEPARAERLILSGDIVTGRRLWDMGVVDELAQDGEGMQAVNEFIRRHQRQANGRLALRSVRERVLPLTHAELVDVVEMWVTAAMQLTSRDLRVMNRIVAAQSRLTGHADESEPAILRAADRLEAVA